ncbi:MAG TPA: DUF3313 family protein [Caulobacteraceae bacterium]|jgi:hypothetical protein
MDRRCFALTAIAACAVYAAPTYAAAPTTWDGLVQVKSKRFALAYLAPGADFAPYHKVMIDPVEIAFKKNYVRDYNSSHRGLSSQIRDSDVERMVAGGSKSATSLFAKAFSDAEYQVVTEPGPDVLRVHCGVVDIYVNAPDVRSAGRRTAVAPEAGYASFFVEARDSMTGALLGRVLDKRYAGDSIGRVRTSVSNRADFEALFRTWAKQAVAEFGDLRNLPATTGA